MRHVITGFLGLLLLAGLYVCGRYNYLLFHSIAEIFSIIIACGIFMVAWNCRRYLDNQYLLFIGVAYLFIGMLDLAHTFAYKGMPLLHGFDANAPTQLWIAARYLESLTWLAAPLMLRRRINAAFYLLGYALIVLFLLVTILYWRIFPDCFLEGAGGLTPFKRVSEYIIILILSASGGFLLKHRHRFHPNILFLLLASIGIKALSELLFTAYAGVYGFSNMLGHFFKIVSFYLIYRAIIQTGLAKPFELLFRELHQNKEWLQTTLRSIADGVIAADTYGGVTFMNKVAEDLTGWPMDESVGKPVKDIFRIVNAQSRAVVEDPVSKVLKSARIEALANHTVLLRRGGGDIPIDDSGAPIQDAKGRMLGVVLVFRDITGRMQAANLLKRSHERLELLAKVAENLLRAEDPLVIVDKICRLVMTHLDCQFFFNYIVESPGELLHLNASAGIPEEAAAAIRELQFGVAVCGCVAREGERIIVENIQCSDDPRTELVKSFGVQAYCCHPLLAQGRLIGTLSFGTSTRPQFAPDETTLMKSVADQVAVAMQRLQTEKQLIELNDTLLQQVAERSKLAEARAGQLQALAVELTEAEELERQRIAQVLHDDLQQILAAAKLHLQCAYENLPPEPMLQKVEAMLVESIRKSRRLSHELSPPVLHHSDLFTALQWLVRRMNEQFGVQVQLEIHTQKRFEFEPLKRFFFRASQELLFNVVKHAGVKAAHILLSEEDEKLVITVSDEGRGFNPEILQSASVKSGLGLISLRERAHALGGCLTIESAPERGSRFTLSVPLGMTKATAPEAPAGVRKRRTTTEQPVDDEIGGTRVLFVDDHKVMRKGLIGLFSGQPEIRVVGEAANGREAIEQVRQLLPDVVVMDISMPIMDGIEATRQIKAGWPAVRIIGLSMHEDEQITLRMREAGADEVVNKTASSAELLKAIYGPANTAGCN
ncbi:MAG: MASE3 domain-containing protein [Desulfobacterales bacterium]|jgi:PAS domain S-box-containing protein|nr:MASE3 domain-containing protein [Desulfobacterales bacterium]